MSYNNRKDKRLKAFPLQALFLRKRGFSMEISKTGTGKAISFLLVVLGNLIYVLSTKLFLLPANLISCGTTGIALILNRLIDLPITVFIFAFNVLMIVVGWIFMGRKFAVTTIFSSLFYPAALEVLNRLLGDVMITQHIWLNVIFAGLGLGLGLGLVVRGGASTGGMDIPPLVLQKYFRIPMSITLAVGDCIIVLGQAFFHPAEDLLLGILLIILISVTLNKTTVMGTTKTEVKIVSGQSDAIRTAILTDVDRGVTVLYGRGGYSGVEAELILSVVSDYELPKIEQLARAIDPACFIIVSQVKEVWGKGFSYSKIDEPKKR